jgi:hypothetical protein
MRAIGQEMRRIPSAQEDWGDCDSNCTATGFYNYRHDISIIILIFFIASEIERAYEETTAPGIKASSFGGQIPISEHIQAERTGVQCPRGSIFPSIPKAHGQ